MALDIPKKPEEGWIRWATQNPFARQLGYATLMQHLGGIAPFAIFSFTHWLIGIPSVVHLGFLFFVYLCVGAYAIYLYYVTAFNYLNHVHPLEGRKKVVCDEVARKREADTFMENEIAERQRELRQP